MGFPLECCKRAVFHTAGVEPAMNWVMEHMEDADFALPGAKKSSSFTPNEEVIGIIMSMGFVREQAFNALQATENNVERAIEWIFSHADELDPSMDTDEPAEQRPEYRDGSGKYKLVAFISHMGMSTMVGYYVCHILKEDRCVIFNDEKVARSEHPPMDLAYLYLYQRIWLQVSLDTAKFKVYTNFKI